MNKKILFISSSPNKGGNSETLGDWLIENINQDRYELEKIHLYDFNLSYSSPKNYVFKNEEKPQEQDAQSLFNKIEGSDHIVLTFPIWNFGPPAILKNLLDRSSNIGLKWSPEKKTKVKNWTSKKFYILYTTGAPALALTLNVVALIQTYLTLKYFGAKVNIVSRAFKCGSGDKNLVSSRSKLKKKIQKKGKRIFK